MLNISKIRSNADSRGDRVEVLPPSHEAEESFTDMFADSPKLCLIPNTEETMVYYGRSNSLRDHLFVKRAESGAGIEEIEYHHFDPQGRKTHMVSEFYIADLGLASDIFREHSVYDDDSDKPACVVKTEYRYIGDVREFKRSTGGSLFAEESERAARTPEKVRLDAQFRTGDGYVNFIAAGPGGSVPVLTRHFKENNARFAALMKNGFQKQ